MLKNMFFLIFLLSLTPVFSASNVVVSPDSMTSDAGAWITITADVASGSDIEIFFIADYNGDGIKNGPDFILKYYKLQEGVGPLFTGSPKPADEDGTNAHLQTKIGLWGSPIIAGKYIIAVKDSGAEASDTFTINQPVTGQTVSGALVTESDIPVDGVIMAQDVNENEWIALTDPGGTYTINLPTGMCAVAGIHLGLITDFEADSAQMVSLDPMDNLTDVTLKVYNGDYTVSGKVTRTGGGGVPYLMTWAETDSESEDMSSNVITDADGNFQIPVKSGSWEVGLDEADLNERGLIGKSEDEIQISDNVINFDFTLQNADAWITGKVTKKSDGTPVTGCEVYAQNNNEWYSACFTRGPDGSYALLVQGGNWMVQIDEDFIFTNGYVQPQAINVSPSSGSPATDIDFELETPTSFIEAEVKETGSNIPVAGIEVWINDENWNWLGGRDTDEEGKALLGVMPGSYHVGLSTEDVMDRNYIMPQNQDVTVATSETVKVAFSLVTATGSIEGTVTHNASPVSGVNISLFDSSYMWSGHRETSATGYYKIPVNPGTYYVQPNGNDLIERGIAPAPIQQVDAEAGVNTKDFNLSSPNCAINIHINGEGTPLQPLQGIGTFVQPITEPYFPLATIETNASGVAAYPISNGTYDVGMFWDDVRGAGFTPQQNYRVSVSNGETLDAYFQLRALNADTTIGAILNIFSIDDAERMSLDKNEDGRLDVADVIRFILD
ncbi:carboxypeptidase regulatory-like domain-containing protein [Candidatus Sumerlaeota bacterium]|nr:carboxypeptidase regulatory-like domain-containing protein [Candidatus Sumerlaeota bacterium]